MDQTRYIIKKRDHEYVELEMVGLLTRVCAFYEERNAIMDCPFVFFHFKMNIAKHVEL